LSIYYKFLSDKRKNSLHSIKKKKAPVYISLTTYPPRITTLWLTLETLLHQTVLPDKIIVYLSRKQFSDESKLPKILLKQQKRGIDFVFVDEDYKSHKKYYYLLKYCADKPFITVDDDLLYDSKLVERLIHSHKTYSNEVICSYGYTMNYQDNGLCQSYNSWKLNSEKKSASFDTFFGSGGGTLFPVGCFYTDVLDHEIFTRLTPTADDVWLNAMVRLNNVKIRQISVLSILNIPTTKRITLSKDNVGLNKNDEQINAVMNFYGKSIFSDQTNF